MRKDGHIHWTWKEVVMDYVKILFWHSFGGTKNNSKNLRWDSWCIRQDSNWVPAKVLPLGPTCSWLAMGKSKSSNKVTYQSHVCILSHNLHDSKWSQISNIYLVPISVLYNRFWIQTCAWAEEFFTILVCIFFWFTLKFKHSKIFKKLAGANKINNS